MPKKIFNKFMAMFLAYSMLIGTAGQSISLVLSSIIRSPEPAYTDLADNAASIDSAYACDASGHTYTVEDGNIMHGGIVLVSDNADQILYSENRIYYNKDSEIKSLDLDTGDLRTEGMANGDIISFSMYNNRLYTYDGDTLSKLDGAVVLDMNRSVFVEEHEDEWISLELDKCLFFSVLNEDEYLLYFDNPDYDPEDAFENPEQRIVCKYSVSRDIALFYNPYDLDDASLDPDSSGDIKNLSTDSSGVSATSLATAKYAIGNNTFPLDEYPVNSFFTKNGKSCTCHNKGICVAARASRGCNCMRYYPSESNCEIDLMSSQCYGFAEFCEYRAYGYIDKRSSAKFYNAFGGKKSAKTWTANTVKETLTKVGAGGHLRVGGHSLFVISVSATGFITYEANKSRTNYNCIVYTTSWTWDSFYSSRSSSDILFYYMPKDVSNDPITQFEYTPGNYQVKASALNLRKEPTISSNILTKIPDGTIIYIESFNSDKTWGKTFYNGHSGWVSLDYVFYLSEGIGITGITIETPPNKTAYFVDDSFTTEGMSVYATFTDGTTSEISGYTCNGYNMKSPGTYTVIVSYNGHTASFKITVELKRIYPTAISLDVNKLALLTGDSYELLHTILPANANMLTLAWNSSNPDVATVENGVITTYKAGKTTITVTTVNNISASCVLSVVDMPEGTSWSVGADGEPLDSLPLGITPIDYSVRYRIMQKNGSYGEWIYLSVGDDLPPLEGQTVQYQYRAITVSFISDGRNAFEPMAVDIDTYVELNKYVLEKEGSLFAGWFKDGTAAQNLDTSKAYGSRVLIESDTEFYAGWIDIDMVDADLADPLAASEHLEGFGFAGAQFAMNNDYPGIRFFTRIRSSILDDLKKLTKNYEYGTVVILKSALKKELVIGGSKAYLNSKEAVKVPANNTYAVYGDYIIYNALVTGFTDSYLASDFAARPYITYKDANGLSHTYYYTCTGEDTSYGAYYTSLYDVALIAYESADNMLRLWIKQNILDKV